MKPMHLIGVKCKQNITYGYKLKYIVVRYDSYGVEIYSCKVKKNTVEQGVCFIKYPRYANSRTVLETVLGTDIGAFQYCISTRKDTYFLLSGCL